MLKRLNSSINDYFVQEALPVEECSDQSPNYVPVKTEQLEAPTVTNLIKLA